MVDWQLTESRFNRVWLKAFENKTPLSRRQTEVLCCAALGKCNKEIAVILGIDQRTVSNHMTMLMAKLGACNRTDAVVKAMHKGWVNIND